MTAWASPLYKWWHVCTPDGHPKAWTRSLNGMYFPNNTNQVLAIIKMGVTKTAWGAIKCLLHLFIYLFIFQVSTMWSTVLGWPSMVNAKFQIHRILAWGPWVPGRCTKELQQPGNLKLYMKFCVKVHKCIFPPLGKVSQRILKLIYEIPKRLEIIFLEN